MKAGQRYSHTSAAAGPEGETMKKRVRFLSILLILVLAAGVLSGCAAGQTGTGSAANTSAGVNSDTAGTDSGNHSSAADNESTNTVDNITGHTSANQTAAAASGNTETTNQTVSTQTADTQSAAGRPGAADGWLKSVPLGESVQADLNGSGIQTVTVKLKADTDGGGKAKIVVGNTTYKTKEYVISPDQDYVIMDIDASDQNLEIGILDWGPSDDLTTNIYELQNGSMKYLGYVEGFIGGGSMGAETNTDDFAGNTTDVDSLDGSGVITGTFRLDVLQTWWANCTWKLSDGKISFVKQKIYDVTNPEEIAKDYGTKLIHKITLYASPDLNAETSIVKPSDAQVIFPKTDNKHWVMMQTTSADGSTVSGWFYLKDFNDVQTTPGKTMESQNVFDGLCMAD